MMQGICFHWGGQAVRGLRNGTFGYSAGKQAKGPPESPGGQASLIPAQLTVIAAFSINTTIKPTSATMDCTTEMVLVASPMVMPKDSFTIQKPA